MDLWEHLSEKLPHKGMPWKLLFYQYQEGRESGSHSIRSSLEYTAGSEIRDQEAAASAPASLYLADWFLDTGLLLQKTKQKQKTPTLFTAVLATSSS